MHIFCCLRRATFDWPKVAKGQSGRGASAPPPFPTPIPLQTAKHRGMGTQMEPSEAGPFGRGGARERTDFSPLGGNGGERTLRRRWPPYRVTPWGSSIATSVSTGSLRCHAAGAGGADAPPQQWDLWPNSKAFSLDKTVPPSIQGRHAPTPRLVHKPGGGKIGPKLFPVSPTDGRGREGC